MTMATYEKLPLVQPTIIPRHRSQSRWGVTWRFLPLVALALIWYCRPVLLGDDEATPVGSSLPQCPQVDALFPSEGTEALSAMEEYLDTAKFREETAARMTGVVQIPSESYDDMGPVGEDKRWETMGDVAVYLEKTFPLVHSNLKLEKVNTFGLLYTWKGSDESLKPTVLMAHLDVVPVAKSTVDQWTYPPYSGHYDGKFVWGRGAGDCKNTLIAILETAELLINAGFKPKRAVVFSFGFDEEISGTQGAGHLANFLIERYGKDGAAIIVDEGSGVVTQWGAQFATPAIAEKGYIDVDVVVRMPGGHSSVPPAHNGIGVMAEFITLIEANLYEPHFYSENPFVGQLECGASFAPEFPPEWKKLLSSGKMEKLAQEVAKSNDILKYLFTTSVAVDLIGGGVKVNALPERTTATINHRVNIGEHPADVIAKLTKLAAKVADKYNLALHAFTNETETPSSITLIAQDTVLEPAPVSPTDVDSLTPYAILSGTTRALYGEKLVMAPGLSTGNTDTRFYWDLTKYIYRFEAGWDPEDDGGEGLGGIHTVDERVSITGHINNVRWYGKFIRNMDEATLA